LLNFKITLALFFSFGIGISLLAQDYSGPVQDDCITVQEVYIPFDEKRFTLRTNEDYRENYNLVYYADEDEFTFWYKLIITQNCTMKFSVKASTLGDDYDFMLYKFTSTNFCETIINNVAVPLNDNFYEPAIESKNSTGSMLLSSQKEIDVELGDIYYISVMNIYGDDCGHRLLIDACSKSMTLNSVHKPCFTFSQPQLSAPLSKRNVDTEAPIITDIETTPDLGDTIIVDDYVFIDGIVRDNNNASAINAQITFVDEVTGDVFSTTATELGGYEITLERGRRYKITCEALGHYEIKGIIEFLKPSTYDFYLLKIKEGRTFVMKNILFHPSTYALKEESYLELDILVHYLEKNQKLKIQIEGHTAGNTPVKTVKPEYRHLGEEWNYTGSAHKLSKLRAVTVKKYLIKKGINSSRVLAKGYGASQTLLPNPKSKEEKALNMRVEVRIINKREDYGYPIHKSALPID
jgi:outer membrane protein OmpA-like peptidoglycan-associated protein